MAAAEAGAEDGAATCGRGGGRQRRGGRRAQRRGAGRGRAPLHGGPVPAAGAAGGHGCGVRSTRLSSCDCQRALPSSCVHGRVLPRRPCCELGCGAVNSPECIHGWQRAVSSGMRGEQPPYSFHTYNQTLVLAWGGLHVALIQVFIAATKYMARTNGMECGCCPLGLRGGILTARCTYVSCVFSLRAGGRGRRAGWRRRAPGCRTSRRRASLSYQASACAAARCALPGWSPGQSLLSEVG
jgi:hypothetical protein